MISWFTCSKGSMHLPPPIFKFMLKCSENPDLLLTSDGVGLALRESFAKSRELFTASNIPPRFLGGILASRAYKIKNKLFNSLRGTVNRSSVIPHVTVAHHRAHRPRSGVILAADCRHEPGLWHWIPVTGRHGRYPKVPCTKRQR